MKSADLKMVAEFLSEYLDYFAVYLAVEYDIDGETEAGVIIERLEQGAERLERPCGDDVQTNLMMRPVGSMMTAEASS